MRLKPKTNRPSALSQTLKDLELQLEAWDRLAKRRSSPSDERDLTKKAQVLLKKLQDQIKDLS